MQAKVDDLINSHVLPFLSECRRNKHRATNKNGERMTENETTVELPLGLNKVDQIVFDIDNTLAYPSPYNNTERKDMFNPEFGVKLLGTPIAPWISQNPSICFDIGRRTKVAYITGRHAIWKGVTSLWLFAGGFKGGEQVYLEFDTWDNYKQKKVSATLARIKDVETALVVDDNKEILDSTHELAPHAHYLFIKDGEIENLW
jgi:hypothetical protein